MQTLVAVRRRAHNQRAAAISSPSTIVVLVTRHAGADRTEILHRGEIEAPPASELLPAARLLLTAAIQDFGAGVDVQLLGRDNAPVLLSVAEVQS